MAIETDIIIDNLPVAEETAVSVGNLGCEGFSGTAKYVMRNGVMAIKQEAGDTCTITVDAGSVPENANYYGVEIEVEYDLLPDQVWPAGSLHTMMQINSNGGRAILYGRARSAVEGHDNFIDGFNSWSATEIDHQAFQTYTRRKYKIQWYFKNDVNGYIGFAIDGTPCGHVPDCDGTLPTNYSGLSIFTPEDSATFDCYITSIRSFTDDEVFTEINHDRTNTLLGQKRFWSTQLHDDFGFFEQTSGAGSIAFDSYNVSGGTISNRHRGIVSGGEVVLEMRADAGMEYTHMPIADDGSVMICPMNLNDTTDDLIIEMGTTTDGDIIKVEFRGSEGVDGSRKIYVDDVDTTITYDNDNRIGFAVCFGQNGVPSKVYFADMTDDTAFAQKAWTYEGWDYDGIPQINKFKVTIPSGAEFENPLASEYIDLPGVSSFTEADSNALTPEYSIPTHVTKFWDVRPEFSDRAEHDHGIKTVLLPGRSGQGIEEFEVLWGASYQALGALGSHARVWLPEWAVNSDTGDPDIVIPKMKTLMDVTTRYGIKLNYGELVPRKAGGSNSVSDAQRQEYRDMNTTIENYGVSKGRPDLNKVSRFVGTRTDAECADEYFATDDVHWKDDGDEQAAGIMAYEGEGLGVLGSTSSNFG